MQRNAFKNKRIIEKQQKRVDNNCCDVYIVCFPSYVHINGLVKSLTRSHIFQITSNE